MTDTTRLKEAAQRLLDKVEVFVGDMGYWRTELDALRSALAAPPGSDALQGWQPIETAPEEGEFLVYMPGERSKIQAARFHPKVRTIGNHFAFDLTKPTHWMPLPPAPAQAGPKETM